MKLDTFCGLAHTSNMTANTTRQNCNRSFQASSYNDCQRPIVARQCKNAIDCILVVASIAYCEGEEADVSAFATTNLIITRRFSPLNLYSNLQTSANVTSLRPHTSLTIVSVYLLWRLRPIRTPGSSSSRCRIAQHANRRSSHTERNPWQS
jgi:hypothetical protein